MSQSAEIEKLLAEVVTLRAALHQYGRHAERCALRKVKDYRVADPPCDCGFADLLK